MKKVIIVMLICLLAASSGYTLKIDREKWKTPDSNIHFMENFKPYSVISFGFSQRVDNRDYLTHTPTLRIRLYTYLNPSIATKFGIGYNNSTKTNGHFYWNSEEISDFILEGGMRFQEPHGAVSFYFEAGFESHNYIVHRGGADNTSKAGINFAIGGEIKLSKSTKIDISLRHTFNYTRKIYPVGLPESFTNPPPIYWDDPIEYYNNLLDDAFFNPSTLQVMIGFKL